PKRREFHHQRPRLAGAALTQHNRAFPSIPSPPTTTTTTTTTTTPNNPSATFLSFRHKPSKGSPISVGASPTLARRTDSAAIAIHHVELRSQKQASDTV